MSLTNPTENLSSQPTGIQNVRPSSAPAGTEEKVQYTPEVRVDSYPGMNEETSFVISTKSDDSPPTKH